MDELKVRLAAYIIGFLLLLGAGGVGIAGYLVASHTQKTFVKVLPLDSEKLAPIPIPEEGPPLEEPNPLRYSHFNSSAVETPTPTPSLTPLPPLSIKQIDERRWRVHLTAKDWWDSGIPIIANQLSERSRSFFINQEPHL